MDKYNFNVCFVCMGAENLGIEWISAYLKQRGINTTLVFDPVLFEDQNSIDWPLLSRIFSITDDIAEEVVSKKPDMVGISSMSTNYKWALRVARKIKEINNKIPIVFGGIHPSIVPEVVIKEDCVDYVIQGEGEYSLFHLIKVILNGEEVRGISGIFAKSANGEIVRGLPPVLIEDINELPFPDKSLFVDYLSIQNGTYRTMCSRGCAFRCTYCCHDYLKKLYTGRYVRQRTVDNVISELLYAKKHYNPKSIHFNDDIFTYNRQWTLNFLKEYRRLINLPYLIITHPAFINEEIAIHLKNSGCYRIKLGIQSLNNKTKIEILRRNETNDIVERCFDILDRNKVPYSADHILGLPNETLDDLENAATFYMNHKYLNMINSYWLTYFPKTSIIDIADRYNTLPASKEDIELRGERGEIKTYLSGGGIEDLSRKKIYEKYEILFASIGALPKGLVRRLWTQYNRVFDFLPYNIRIVLFLISIFKFRDRAWFTYIKDYTRNSALVMKEKLKKLLNLLSK